MADDVRPLYPSNVSYALSGRQTQQGEPKPKLERVAKGSKKKPTVGQRLVKAFVGPDIQDVGTYFLWECVVPAMKYAVLDSILMIFGERPIRNWRRMDGTVDTTRTNYSARYSGPAPASMARTARVDDIRYSCSDIVYEDKADALEVLDMLLDRITEYKVATVADVYDLSGITVNDHTMYNWGWKDLSTAEVRRVREGWSIVYPRVQDLK